MLEEVMRLQSLVDRLLELARIEGGGAKPQLEQVRLDGLVSLWLGELLVLAENKGQHIHLESEACACRTDILLLRQAFGNVMENAIKYSPEGSAIVVRVHPQEDGCVVLEVEDRGPGIDPSQSERIAERFFRVEHSRSRSTGGFGLGLAITSAYLTVLGGSLEHRPAQPQGCVFTLRLPALPAR